MISGLYFYVDGLLSVQEPALKSKKSHCIYMFRNKWLKQTFFSLHNICTNWGNGEESFWGNCTTSFHTKKIDGGDYNPYCLGKVLPRYILNELLSFRFHFLLCSYKKVLFDNCVGFV